MVEELNFYLNLVYNCQIFHLKGHACAMNELQLFGDIARSLPLAKM